MTTDMKFIINGKEVKLPPELMQIAQIYKEVMPMLNPNPEPQIPTPQPPMPCPCPPPFPQFTKTQRPQQHFVRKIIFCKDTEARGVIIEMNQRLNRLEEILIKKQLTDKKKPLKEKKNTQKTISKPKEVPKPKGNSKVKKKVTEKKIGKKK